MSPFDTPVFSQRLDSLATEFTGIRQVLLEIRNVLDDILIVQQQIRNQAQPTVAKDKKSEKILEAKT